MVLSRRFSKLHFMPLVEMDFRSIRMGPTTAKGNDVFNGFMYVCRRGNGRIHKRQWAEKTSALSLCVCLVNGAPASTFYTERGGYYQ